MRKVKTLDVLEAKETINYEGHDNDDKYVHVSNGFSITSYDKVKDRDENEYESSGSIEERTRISKIKAWE